MDRIDFLRTVTASEGEGLYCAFDNATKKHRWATDWADLLPWMDAASAEGHDVYFALGKFEDDDGRTKDNVLWMGSLFIDMDGYPSPQDAWRALVDFLKKTKLWNLGKPIAVVSGGGVHAYWPFTHGLPREEWQPMAENLKRLCKQEGLKYDTKVTADAARVLRPPGTFNYKPDYPEPVEVQIVVEGARFHPTELGNAIADLLVGDTVPEPTSNVIPLNIPGNRPASASSAASMFKNTATYFKNIMVKTEAGEGCAQLQYYLDHATEKVEPLWRDLMSVAKKCDDGWEWAERLSAMHPYDPQEVQNKWRALENQGPHWCKTFDDSNPGVCPTCPHWKTRITTPIMLGRETLKTAEAKTVEVKVDKTPVDSGVVRYDRPEAPHGFWYGENGGIITMIKPAGKGAPFEAMVLSYDMYAVGMFRNKAGDHMAHFVAHHPLGVIEFNLTMKTLGSKDETIKALAEKNIMSPTPEASQGLHRYAWACASTASQERRALVQPEQYGWQEDGGFVFASRKFSKGRKPTRVPMADGLVNVEHATQPQGTLEANKRVWDLMVSRNMNKHLGVALMATAAPLIRFTGIKGLVVHCYSPDSGTGKSLALDLASSVWGDPVRFKVNSKTSDVAMFNRIGLLNSLPLVSDELTTLTREKFGWFPDFLLSVTEGKGKDRLVNAGSGEQVNKTSWASVAVLSSNSEVAELLLTRKHAVEGEVRRLLEFHILEEITFNDHEIELVKSLQHNFGIVGYHLAEYLAEADPDELRDAVAKATVWVRDKLRMTGAERFWASGIACAMQMGVILNEIGFIKLPLDAIFKEYRNVVEQMRHKLGQGRRSAMDVLNTYLEQHSGNFAVFDMTRDANVVAMEFGASRQKINQLMGRIEHRKNGTTEITISEANVRAHCLSLSFPVIKFVGDLASADGFMVKPGYRRIGKGTPVETAETRCYVITMKRDKFDAINGEDAVGEG